MNDDIDCNYYDETKYNKTISNSHGGIKVINFNIRSLPANGNEMKIFLNSHHCNFDVMLLSEMGSINNDRMTDLLPDYTYDYKCPHNCSKGGVGMFIIQKTLCNVDYIKLSAVFRRIPSPPSDKLLPS